MKYPACMPLPMAWWSLGDCGCRVSLANGVPQITERCALHAAAPKMLKALKQMRRAYDVVPVNNAKHAERCEAADALADAVIAEAEKKSASPIWPNV